MRRHIEACSQAQRVNPITGATTRAPSNLLPRLEIQAAIAVFVGGLPFSHWEDEETARLLKMLHPTIKPPSGQALAEKLLPLVFQHYKRLILEDLARECDINIILEASYDVDKMRTLRVSAHIPEGRSFYWKTMDVGAVELGAANLYSLLEPHLLTMTRGDLGKINSFCTDTCRTMGFAGKLQDYPQLRHTFVVVCDSYGLRLLGQDVLEMALFAEVLDDALTLISTLRNEKFIWYGFANAS